MTNSTNILQIIEKILRRYGNFNGSIPPEKDLYSELGIESVKSISILLEMEEDFGISIDDNQFVKARTFNQLVNLIKSKDE